MLERSTSRTTTQEQKTINRKLDVIRRLVQVATAVVMALLLILWFVDHPSLAPHTKQPILGALFIICAAYALALEVGRGSTGVVLFLVASGLAISMFAMGYAVRAIQPYLL